MSEEWRQVNGFADYQVSNLGRVRRHPDSNNCKIRAPLKACAVQGYKLVTIRRDNKSWSRRVHILVCEAFHGPRPSARHHAAHNNGTSTDNRAENLRWATPEENQADRISHGTDIRGSDVHGAVLEESQIPPIRKLLDQHVPCQVIAQAYGVHPTTIHQLKQGKTWEHVQ